MAAARTWNKKQYGKIHVKVHEMLYLAIPARHAPSAAALAAASTDNGPACAQYAGVGSPLTPGSCVPSWVVSLKAVPLRCWQTAFGKPPYELVEHIQASGKQPRTSRSLSCAFDDLPSRVLVKLESAFEGPAPSSAGVQTSLAVASSRSDILPALLPGPSQQETPGRRTKCPQYLSR